MEKHFSKNYTTKVNIPKHVFIMLKIFKKYSFTRNINMFKQYKTIYNLPKKGKVLDVGCGDGVKFKIIKFLRPDLELYGIDLSDKEKFLTKDINFQIMSGDNLKYKDNIFDLVLNFHVLEHVFNAQDFVNEFARVLKKGGKIIIETPYVNSIYFPGERNFYFDPTHYRPFTKRSLKRLFDVNGTIHTEISEAYRYGKINIFWYLILFPYIAIQNGFLQALLNIFFKNTLLYIGTKK